ETHQVLKHIRAYLDTRHPDIALLGEISGNDSVETLKEYFGAGDECHLIYHFPLVGKLFLSLKRNDQGIIQKFVEESKGIPPNTEWATLLRHHDEMAIATLPEADQQELLNYFDPEKKYRFNQGASLRLATMFRGNKKKILDAFQLLFSVPGSPIIYYGDEIGMENEMLSVGEKDTRRSVRGKFDWEEADTQKVDPESLFNGIASMIQARKRQSVRDSN
ncbi:MAG: alpha-amylase family glycosyl hydrolase, partial [bacterium]|nr:alpha-amylase family glycosyl hydrolase [bacterium]